MQPEQQAPQQRASQVVLQWISYGLWGWTLFALSAVLSATLTYFFVTKDGDYALIIYVLAALVCLLPLAFVADRLYRKVEPEQKHGFAAVVMVVHAVLAFLATVAALITAVISGFSIAIEAPSDGVTIAIISSLIVAILGGMLFVRILGPIRLRRFIKFFSWVVLAVASIAIIATLVGPFRALIATRDDRLVEDNLYTIDSEIRNYASEKGSLPLSLKDLELDGNYQEGAQKLIKRNMVTYKPNSKNPTSDGPTYEEEGMEVDYSDYFTQGSPTRYYELCVNYKKSKGNGSNSQSDLFSASSNHGSGEVCYERDTSPYFD